MLSYNVGPLKLKLLESKELVADALAMEKSLADVYANLEKNNCLSRVQVAGRVEVKYIIYDDDTRAGP
jgi:hypothetical protein